MAPNAPPAKITHGAPMLYTMARVPAKTKTIASAAVLEGTTMNEGEEVRVLFVNLHFLPSN